MLLSELVRNGHGQHLSTSPPVDGRGGLRPLLLVLSSLFLSRSRCPGDLPPALTPKAGPSNSLGPPRVSGGRGCFPGRLQARVY